MSLLRSRVAVLDTETSGWPSNPSASVIDVGGVVLDLDGSEVSSYESLVRPLGWGPWADGATAIHGLHLADVADAPKPADVARAIVRWLADHDCRYVTAYNVAFDRPMLTRMGLVDVTWASCVMLRAMDIMGPAGALRPTNPSHPRYQPDTPWLFPPLCPKPQSGTSAAEFFGVTPVEPAHRALSDARTAAAVLVAMRKKVSLEG